MARYKLHGQWRQESASQIGHYIVRELSSDLIDTQGKVFPDGAFRVTVEDSNTGAKTTKTWKGELAWSNAQRYASDQILALRRAS